MVISVLHVLHSFRQGGMENMVAQMAWRLPRREFAVSVCALSAADDFKERLPLGTPVLEMKKRGGIDLMCALRLRSLIGRTRPAVVHSHNWNALIYSVLAIGGGRTPLLHGEHALWYGWERSPLRLLLRRALYSRCDVVHSVSEGQAAEALSLGLANHVDFRVIRNGVDIEKFSPQDKAMCRAALGLPLSGLCIGMVARCVPEKRHEVLLRAFEKTAAAFPDVTLVLAGAGGICETVVRAAVAEHPFAGRIFWLGHRNDMAAVYNALDLLLLTSTSEGMSNASLEAMSCGVPVLMNQSCGSEELIVENINGGVAAMGNADEVACAVGRFLASPADLQRLGRAARDWVVRELPLEKTVDAYAEVYRELAQRA